MHVMCNWSVVTIERLLWHWRQEYIFEWEVAVASEAPIHLGVSGCCGIRGTNTSPSERFAVASEARIHLRVRGLLWYPRHEYISEWEVCCGIRGTNTSPSERLLWHPRHQYISEWEVCCGIRGTNTSPSERLLWHPRHEYISGLLANALMVILLAFLFPLPIGVRSKVILRQFPWLNSVAE
jgi:hypothetical protein